MSGERQREEGEGQRIKVKGSMAKGSWWHCRLCEPRIIGGRIWKHERSGGKVYKLFEQSESMARPGTWL